MTLSSSPPSAVTLKQYIDTCCSALHGSYKVRFIYTLHLLVVYPVPELPVLLVLLAAAVAVQLTLRAVLAWCLCSFSHCLPPFIIVELSLELGDVFLLHSCLDAELVYQLICCLLLGLAVLILVVVIVSPSDLGLDEVALLSVLLTVLCTNELVIVCIVFVADLFTAYTTVCGEYTVVPG